MPLSLSRKQREDRLIVNYRSRHPPKAATPAPSKDNNYATRTYDFKSPMEQPADWERTNQTPEWCKYHGGGKHKTAECMTVKDDIAVSQSLPKPSIAANKLGRENKIKKRQAKGKALGEKRRSTLRRLCELVEAQKRARSSVKDAAT
ncbi:hypothetical protein Q7P35_004438 [Cladosporium inversicolor]